jgi:hypothetical protein
MKYFVMATPLPIPIPPELFQEARDWIGERIDDQRFDCVYMFLGGGGVAIRNAESHEEVYDELVAYPLYGFFDWSVEPLVDWEHGFGTIISGRAGG